MQRHASASLVTFVRELSADKTKLTEGTPEFDEFRDCALRHAERHLLLAASLYRRALDLMIPSSAPWAHVTLYYGAFHAAQSFLAMFGGWCDGKRYVEVTRSAQGISNSKLSDGPKTPAVHTGFLERVLRWMLCSTAMDGPEPVMVPATCKQRP